MKRKLLTVLLTLITALCLCFGLAACNGEGKDGIGIKSVEVDENGDLKVTLDDGTVLNAGKVTANEPAEEGTEGLQYQKIKGEDGEYTAAVVGLGTAWDTDIVIPSSYRGLKVTAIGNNAFNASMDARNENLTSITIPDSVTSIRDRAFYGCSGLTRVDIHDLAAWCKIDFEDYYSNPLFYAHHLYVDNVESKKLTIPDEITEIKSCTFYGCSGLESIEIPDSVTSIGSSAFYGCSGLTSIIIPDSVTSIENYTFSKCSGLTSITIPDSVTSIGSSAFEDCSSLESVTIGNGVTSIESSTFSSCSGLTSIEIPASVTSIGSSAFEDCSGLTSITIPNGVTSIGDWAFSSCSGLTSIEIPASVTSIGSSAFEDCSGLTSITIPDGVTSIGDGTFSGCSGLTSVILGNSVTSIRALAFEDCSKLESVYYMGTADEWNRISIDYYNNGDLRGATRYYYSAEENYDGEHWHYDPVTNQPVVWTKEEA